jgi:calcium-dependent protein kinase
VVPGSEVPWLQQRAGAPSVSDRYILSKVIRIQGSVLTRVAVSVSSGEVVACKTVPKSHLVVGTQAVAENLRREVSIMASPWLARLHAVYEDDDAVHLVMDRCDGLLLGDTMRTVSAQGRMVTEEQAAMVAWAVVNEVRALHANGVMLRLVEPDRFMWVVVPDDGLALKVVDFSLAVEFRPGSYIRYTTNIEHSIGFVQY